MKTDEQFSDNIPLDDDQIEQTDPKGIDISTTTNIDRKTSGPYVTRSGRTVKAPIRFIEEYD